MIWTQEIKGCCVVLCQGLLSSMHVNKEITIGKCSWWACTVGLVSMYLVVLQCAAVVSTLYQFNALISGPNYGSGTVRKVYVSWCACMPGFSLWSVHKPYLHVLNSWWCAGLRQCVWWRGCLCAKLKWSGGRAWALTPLKNPIALLTAADRQ